MTSPLMRLLKTNSLIKALRYALDGLVYVYRKERAFRQEALVLVFMTALLFWMTCSVWLKIGLWISWIFVMVVELLNTAVEKTLDLVHPGPHPLVKAAKDMGAAAVLLAVLISCSLWGCALFLHTYSR